MNEAKSLLVIGAGIAGISAALEAAEAGADLVVLPELWGSGYDLAHAAEYATPVGAGLFGEMAALAREVLTALWTIPTGRSGC